MRCTAGSPRRPHIAPTVTPRCSPSCSPWRCGGACAKTNPAKGIERNLEHHRRRYLVNGELERLTAALAAHSDKQAADAIRGPVDDRCKARRSLAMRWADLDLAVGVRGRSCHLVRSKRNTTKSHCPPRSGSCCRRSGTSRFGIDRAAKVAFPGSGDTGHRVELKKNWAELCAAAGITGLRLHDLRHSFAIVPLLTG